MRCEFCGDSCATCVDTREKCTSCPTDLLMMPSTWTCHIQCPEGYVQSVSRPEECEPCHQSCKTCKGATQNECLSCHLETLQLITVSDRSQCIDCQLAENIGQYPECTAVKILGSKKLVKSDPNYSISDDITLELTFEGIDEYRSLLESL